MIGLRQTADLRSESKLNQTRPCACLPAVYYPLSARIYQLFLLYLSVVSSPQQQILRQLTKLPSSIVRNYETILHN